MVVVNRGAGGGRAGRAWERMAQGEPRLVGTRIIARDGPDAALADLGDALDAGRVRRVVAVGGDGTLSRVADLLLTRTRPCSPSGDPAGAGGGAGPVSLGIVPCGTGSDLARALGIPRDPPAALQRALTAPTRPIDALEIRSACGRRRFAVNVVSAGVSGRVDEAVAALPFRGPATYLRATLGALARYRPAPCRIRVDGELWHAGDLLLLAVANGPTFGCGMRIAPGARLDDGLADVVLVPRLPLNRVPTHIPRLYLGRHLSSPYVHWRRGRRIEIEPTDGATPLDVDGDPWPAAAATIEVHPAALHVVA